MSNVFAASSIAPVAGQLHSVSRQVSLEIQLAPPNLDRYRTTLAPFLAANKAQADLERGYQILPNGDQRRF